MKPSGRDKTEEDAMIVTRLSKASWFKLEIGKSILHLDPGYAGYFENQQIPLDACVDKADLILISHDHKDHLQSEALSRIMDEDTIILAPPRCEKKIESDHLILVKPGDIVETLDMTILATHAYNTPEGHSTRKVHPRGSFVGYLIFVAGKRIYFAGDTDTVPEMHQLAPVDLAFLPIGGTFVMDIDEALDAVRIIRPKIVVPMHQSRSKPEDFREKVHEKTQAQVVVLGVGDKMRLPLDPP